MSIKPVDFQVMIPRTMEVSKSSNDVTNKNYAMQHQYAASTQQNAENTLKQVYSQKQAQEARIAQRQKENNGKEQKKKDKNRRSESQVQEKKMQTSTIDIKV